MLRQWDETYHQEMGYLIKTHIICFDAEILPAKRKASLLKLHYLHLAAVAESSFILQRKNPVQATK